MTDKCKHIIDTKTKIDNSDSNKSLPICVLIYWECESCDKVFSLQDIQNFINTGSNTIH